MNDINKRAPMFTPEEVEAMIRDRRGVLFRDLDALEHSDHWFEFDRPPWWVRLRAWWQTRHGQARLKDGTEEGDK